MRNPKCLQCGTENTESFYLGKKNICKECLSEKNKEEKERIKKLLETPKTPPRVQSPTRSSKSPLRSESKVSEERMLIQNLEQKVEMLELKNLEILEILEILKDEIRASKDVKIASPVKVVLENLTLPVTPVKRAVSPKKEKVKVERTSVERKQIQTLKNNLENKTIKELKDIAGLYNIRIPREEARNKTKLIHLLQEEL